MGEYDDDQLLPVSGLQHLAFCERQAALIHVERSWRENSLTLEGKSLHRTVDECGSRKECRGDLVILRGVDLRSTELGLIGKADVVELRRADIGSGAVRIPGLSGTWMVRPVEYKRGKRKQDNCDEVQLCAQGMCLENTYSTRITEGASYYGSERHRTSVYFDDFLRETVRKMALRFHGIIDSGITPRADLQPKCRRCSLREVCMPEVFARSLASDYVARVLRDAVLGNRP